MDCSNGMNHLHSGFDSPQNAGMVAVLDFCHNFLNKEYRNNTVKVVYGGAIKRMFLKLIFHQQSPAGVSDYVVDGGMRSAE